MSDRIMSRLRSLRREQKYSQAALAARAGVSRAEISAIETDRLVPSTVTALRLSRVLARPVEALFTLSEGSPDAVARVTWAWGPRTGRFWEAQVGPRRLRFPVETSALGLVPHDGVVEADGTLRPRAARGARPTLVLAGCDPAVGVLASELARVSGVRLVAFTRPTRRALELLDRGLVHVAGVHWSGESTGDANAALVRKTVGSGYRLLHLARWQEGVVVGGSVRTRSIDRLARARVRWIAREEGSGARRLLDRLLEPRRATKPRFRHVATDHRAVAEAIREGWAEAGVAVQLAAEECRLDFLSIQHEDYELCFSEALRRDPNVAALRTLLRRAGLKRLVGELPGYEAERTGEERSVAVE